LTAGASPRGSMPVIEGTTQATVQVPRPAKKK
jgi:hypothetical protein